MTTKDIWGPAAWRFLHTITFAYPDIPTIEQKRSYKLFFEQLHNVLPCTICREHFKENLKKYPIESGLDSKDKLVKWLIDFHNEVNKSLGKRQYSYKEVYKLYDNNYSPTKKYLTFGCVALLLGVSLYFILKKLNK